MKLDVFDTYVTQSSGEQMHFDVLLPSGGIEQDARRVAIIWLESIGAQVDNMHLDKCHFCHSTAANPETLNVVSMQGYAILQMEGCPSPI